MDCVDETPVDGGRDAEARALAHDDAADRVHLSRTAGFEVLVVWECELCDLVKLGRRLKRFWFESTK